MPILARGFTLPEVMLAMTFGSLIILAAAKTLPILHQQVADAGRHYRLELVLRQLLFGIEKDLRRSGFCAGECQGKPLLIGNAPGEAANSCVIVAYDLNRNGRWEKSGDAEYFGYRQRAGALEGQRGVTQCAGLGWERLLDQEEVQIEAFSVSQILDSRGGSVVLLSLSGRSTAKENIQRRLEWAVGMEAL
ncbi:prepilin peptidase dependent protein B [Serratia fonticola]|uniref:Prepilin peptidase dependent protein B n=1 Tax=Serratia fonticola TaxID=47917 RepID=A0A559T7D8_SERFO|nr:prepilin peptidase-dependent protein [Serratia fonticola]TQI81949.1 prepilin peptidase dependent protein B [Serratia fonticola]TQI96028.1 prepilin peptidase dependent protein B [Serratia fonticola]TVZ70525.1 prepilin peptidase dependent protein B [Serratia fonticola]